MYLGEPIVQICAAENGFVVVVPDEEAEKQAEAAAKKAGKNAAPYVPLAERTKKLVFPSIGDVLKYLKQNLPKLVGDQKADFDAGFDDATEED